MAKTNSSRKRSSKTRSSKDKKTENNKLKNDKPANDKSTNDKHANDKSANNKSANDKSKKDENIDDHIDIVATNPEHEPILKDYVSNIVNKCFANNYNTGKECYLLVIGGEAINHYIPNKKDKISTADFDLKLVVNPEFTKDEETLKTINVRRLKIVRRLMQCLSNLPVPKGYTELYPKLTIKIHDQRRYVYSEGNKLFWVDPISGEEKFLYYALNKVFSILLCYQLASDKGKNPTTYGFGLIDLSLFYKKPHDFSYFGAKIYESFLNPPFNKKVPIPFIVHNNVRYPTLQYLLSDTYRMALISLDNLAINKDNPEKIEFWTSKVEKYWKKLDVLVNIVKKQNPAELVDDFVRAAKKCFENYKPLAFMNMLCFRTGIVYSTEMKELPECDAKYKKELMAFEACYNEVSNKIMKLH